MRQVSGMKVTRLTLGSLPTCPSHGGVLLAPQGVGMGRRMTAEAVVAEPIGEGRTPDGARSFDDDKRCRKRGRDVPHPPGG